MLLKIDFNYILCYNVKLSSKLDSLKFINAICIYTCNVALALSETNKMSFYDVLNMYHVKCVKNLSNVEYPSTG